MPDSTELTRLRRSSSCGSSRSSSSASSAKRFSYSDSPKEPLLDESDEKTIRLPSIRQFFLFRFIRYIRYAVLTTYRRIFIAVFLLNLVGAAYAYETGYRRLRVWWSVPLLLDSSLGTALNVLIAILIRQDYIINLIFRICLCVPFSAPLWFRKSLARVYEHGGLHSGAAICSVLWFCLLAALVHREFFTYRMHDLRIRDATIALMVLLWSMVLTAHPTFRYYCHNIFEHIHRWAGWLAIAVFWVELYVLTNHIKHQTGPDSYGAVLYKRWDFICHVISTLHIFLPWTPWFRLRKLPVEAQHLSSHVIRLHIKEKVGNCVVYKVARTPLGDWHSFACIPAPIDGVGGSLLVSSAGDWTRKTISSPRQYYWTRGIPTAGVLCMAQIFRKVAIVTTGSGIGPCLGTVMRMPKGSCRILWSASGPRMTFGDEICQSVLDVDPKAVIIDTKKEGRPDLTELVYELYVTSGAEAVFCVSNRETTRNVVYKLRSCGIPAYGPVWDS